MAKKAAKEEVSNMAANDAGSAVLAGGGDDDGYVFNYDVSLDQAEQPLSLPEGYYVADVLAAKQAVNNNSGQPRLNISMVVPPENYPADFPVEHHPDGVKITYYTRDLGNTTGGRYNMRRLCEAFGINLSSSVRSSDFEGKRVKVKVVTREMDDGTKQMQSAFELPTVV